MDSATVAVPGLRWGSHPERREPEARARWAVRAAAVGDALAAAARLERRRLARFVAAVRAADPAASPAALAAVRLALQQGGLTDAAIARAFALIGGACGALRGTVPYDGQLIAARHVLDNRLVEMATGEGKTLTVALAATCAALAGIPVHVITANDYLATRDAAALADVAARLGLSVGCVTEASDPAARRSAYACSITYCTAKELVFDYLRDGQQGARRPGLQARVDAIAADAAGSPVTRLLRGLCLAIIDEADSILVDEARVPLILAAPSALAPPAFWAEALTLATPLAEGTDYRLDAAARVAVLTPAGATRLATACRPLAGLWQHRLHREDTVQLALAALHLHRRDRDYLVRDGALALIDQTTGRVAPGRAWSRGLHQLVEIKEGLAPTQPTVTVAQISYQRYFARYHRLGGLSGTLREARGELRTVYDLPVVAVPLRRPCRRQRLADRWFADGPALWSAVAGRVAALQSAGRPVLVGTESVADAVAASAALQAAGVGHAVLDARCDRDEAPLIARAGVAGAVTVTTNLAGRGTDIALGAGVAERGGLHVLACQLNASPRIDRQLVGRCARQGDPGSCERWLSVDAQLVRDGLPAGLRRLLAHALRGPTAGLAARVCSVLAALLQHAAVRRDAAVRARLLDNDRRLDRHLSFGDPP